MKHSPEFEHIYRTYAPQIYRYLCSIGCPEHDAEDIVQDTFVKALLHIDSFRGDCRLYVWLCQIAKNTWLDLLKKKKRECSAELTGNETALPHPFEWMHFLERLEEPYQSVFLCVVLEGWSYDVLARHYGKSASWARVTYYRARMKLQQMLSEEEERV